MGVSGHVAGFVHTPHCWLGDCEQYGSGLIIRALQQAIVRLSPPRGLLVHSDRGGQYADTEFRALLTAYGFEQSMSRAGETYDNAYAESLFSRYKAELLENGIFRDLA